MKLYLIIPFLSLFCLQAQGVKASRIIYPSNTFTNVSTDTLYINTIAEELVQRYKIKQMVLKLEEGERLTEDLIFVLQEIQEEANNQIVANKQIEAAYNKHKQFSIEQSKAYELNIQAYKKQRNRGYYVGGGAALTILILAIVLN